MRPQPWKHAINSHHRICNVTGNLSISDVIVNLARRTLCPARKRSVTEWSALDSWRKRYYILRLNLLLYCHGKTDRVCAGNLSPYSRSYKSLYSALKEIRVSAPHTTVCKAKGAYRNFQPDAENLVTPRQALPKPRHHICKSYMYTTRGT